MISLNPYLTFAGNCREALEFYKNCFNGEFTLQTFEDANQDVDPAYKQYIMHAEFKTEGFVLMASDGMSGFKADPGNIVSLIINLTDETEQKRIFEALSAGGMVTVPLESTFWGATFGMLTDRFGIHWMLNCTKQ